MVAAAKSLAYDPVRQVVWVNTDLVPRDGGPSRHDARVLELATGREILRIATPELHFPRFAADGRGFFAWQQGSRLALRMTQPGAARGRHARAARSCSTAPSPTASTSSRTCASRRTAAPS